MRCTIAVRLFILLFFFFFSFLNVARDKQSNKARTKSAPESSQRYGSEGVKSDCLVDDDDFFCL